MKTNALPLLALAVLFTTAACRPSYMPVPAELSASHADAWEVSGRFNLGLSQTLAYGPFTAGPADRAGIEVADDQSETHQTFGFAVTESTLPDVAWSCSCTDRAYNDANGQEHGALDCAIVAPDNRNFLLKLDATGEVTPLSGTLADSNGTPVFNVVGTNMTSEGSASDSGTTGYLITPAGGGEAVLAVDVSTAGYIWLRRDVSPEHRWILSTTAASLLLLRDLRNNF